MKLSHDQILSIKRSVTEEFLSRPGVHGMGIGFKRIGEKATDELAIIIHVSKKIDKNLLKSEHLLPESIQGIALDVQVHEQLSRSQLANKVQLKQEEHDLRLGGDVKVYAPLRGGPTISDSRKVNPSYGTLGLIVLDTGGNPGILSAAHVMQTGAIFQPFSNTSAVADLTTSDPTTDSAFAKLRSSNGKMIPWFNWVLDIGAIQGDHKPQISDLNMAVRKRGATTLFTYGHIAEVNFTGIYKDGTPIPNTFLVKNDTSNFCEAGDSGAVLVDDQNRVLGIISVGFPDLGWASCTYIDQIKTNLGISITREKMPTLYVIHEGQKAKGVGDGWMHGAFNTSSSLTTFNDDSRWPPDLNTPQYGTYSPPKMYATRGPCIKPTVNTTEEQLFLIHQDGSDKNWMFWSKSNSTNYTNDQACPSGENAYNIYGSPSAILFEGALWVFWARKAGDESIKQWMWMAKYNCQTWSNESLVPPNASNTIGTTGAPGLCVFDSKLFIVHQGVNDDGKLWLTTYSDKDGYSGDNLIVTDDNNYCYTSGTPALASYKGVLYMVREDSGNNGWLKYNTYSNGVWSPNMLVGNSLRTSGPPSLIVYNDQLVLMREAGDNKGWIQIATSSDGVTWSDQTLLSRNNNNFITNGAPTLAIFPYDIPSSES